MTRDLPTGARSRMRPCSLLAALLLTLGSAVASAQPTGNPQGTAPPPVQGNAQKQPATAGGVPTPLSPGEAASRPATGAREASAAGSGTGDATGRASQTTPATKHSTHRHGTARRSQRAAPPSGAAAPRAQP